MSRKELLDGDGAPPFRTILSEVVLRTGLRDADQWRGQLAYLLAAGDQTNVTLHVLPQNAGLHGLASTDVWFLRLPDHSIVAYIENGYRGELIEEHAAVERLLRAYDVVRDLTFSPVESRKFIQRVLEEVPCEPST